MSRVVHFEIVADQPERAIGFYKNVFGWQFAKWDGPMPYWMITTGAEGQPGINGGLMPRSPEAACSNTIGVQSLDQSIAAVEKNGGKIVVPKMAIPRVGWLAYFNDTEGNLFGLMQPDANAA
jgi:uncharacterized protein